MKLERHVTVLLAAVVVAIGALVLPSAARADDTLYGGSDWYGSAFGILGIGSGDVSGGSPGGGATVSGGFRFNRWLAAEVGGEWIDRITYDKGDGPITCTGTGGSSNGFSAWQVSGGGRAYLGQSIVQPFALAHAGFIQTRDSGGGRSCTGNGFMTRIGGGVDVFVTNGLAVSLLGAYVLPLTGDTKDHDYISIGLGLTWY